MCFQEPLRCYGNALISSTVFVETPVGHLQIVPPGLPHASTREKWKKIFCHRENCLFLESLLLDFFRSSRNDHIFACTLLVKIHSGQLQTVPWHLSCSILREKKASKYFSRERLPFFSEICVFSNLSAPKKMLV